MSARSKRRLQGFGYFAKRAPGAIKNSQEGRASFVSALVACLLAGVVIVGGAFSTSYTRETGSPLHEPESLFGGLLPLPPGAWSVLSIGDSMEINGIGMRVGYFLTDMNPADVLSFYEEVFSSIGLDTSRINQGAGGYGLVATDYSSGLQKGITVFGGSQGSAVLPSITSISTEAKFDEYSERPLPPGPTGARLISDVVTRDGTVRSRVVSMVTDLPLHEALDDLRRRLQIAGYRFDLSDDDHVSGMIRVRDRYGRGHIYSLAGGEHQRTGVMVVIDSMDSAY